MVAVLLAVTVGGSYLGAVVVARHRAQAAADLAALAAAARVPAGTQSACAVAAEVAQAMRAGTARCAVDYLDVVVTIDTPVGRWGIASAAARAGPA
jgi:secretion/DNA translocation related TadE-like protein